MASVPCVECPSFSVNMCKNETYDVPLGILTIDQDKIRTWMRGLGRDLGSRVFSNPDVLRAVFGYEDWYAECCTFSM